MNIGLRLHDAAGATLEEKLSIAHALGCRCVHLALSKAAPGFAMADAPRLLTREYAQEVGALLDKYDLRLALLGCYLNLATPDEAELACTMDCYRAHLRFAGWLGGAMVGTETGAPNVKYQSGPECHTEEALALFIRRLRPVVDAAEEYGAQMAIEPVCRHIVHTPERARQVLDAIGSPRLHIIFDPVNLLDEANVHETDAVLERAIRLLGPDIRLVHIKDYMTDPAACVAAGEGTMDYSRVMRYVHQQNPNVPITLENTTPQNAAKALTFVNSL